MAENALGIEEVRTQLGDLVDDAHFEGTVTRITRRGRHVASIIPAGIRATALSEEAVNAAVDAAWPDLPPGITMGDARRRVIAALNAAQPHLNDPEEHVTLPNVARLQAASDSIMDQLENTKASAAGRERLEKAVVEINEMIRRTKAKTTHQEILTKAVQDEVGTWDANRAQITLAAAGHSVDAKRARAVLRRIATAGLLTRTSQTRAIYDTTEPEIQAPRCVIQPCALPRPEALVYRGDGRDPLPACELHAGWLLAGFPGATVESNPAAPAARGDRFDLDLDIVRNMARGLTEEHEKIHDGTWACPLCDPARLPSQ